MWWYPLVNFLVLLCTLQCQCWNIFCCLRCNEYHVVYGAIIFFHSDTYGCKTGKMHMLFCGCKTGKMHMLFCCVFFFPVISIFLYSEWKFFLKKKAHGLALYHRAFVEFWVLWAFPIRGFLALWAFLTPAHVGQGQIMKNGPIWQVSVCVCV